MTNHKFERSKSHKDGVAKFIDSAKNKVLVAGYGSLLSQYSRQTYSQISGPSIPVIIKGWERAWITRSSTEMQTYAGAVPNSNRYLSAQLLALQFDESFEKREQDYRFTEVLTDSIDTLGNKHDADLQHLLATTPIYICETLVVEPSTNKFPVSLSYVETCLAGSYESCGEKGIEDFFATTTGWQQTHFYDDRSKHRYPRSTPIEDNLREKWGVQIDLHFNNLTG
jgi:hypothetical protein